MFTVFLDTSSKIPAINNIVTALERNGNPKASEVAPDTKDPTTEPSEKNA